MAAATAGEPFESRLDSLFAPLTDGRSPGFAVSVRKGGKTVYERVSGVAELRTMRPIDRRSNFRLASFTKQFTAASIMLLVRDGKLRYDQTLADIFPGFPDYGRKITVRHLLTHTAGLPDYEDLMEKSGKKWTAEHQIQDDEVLALLEHGSAAFAPGTSWSYSNSGYVMLGLIVAKISGIPFPQFLRERIFRPLSMGNSVAYVAGKSGVPNRVYGHSKRNGQFVETDQSSTSATLGDGGIYSNLADLAKWDAALDKGTLLTPAELKTAQTAVKLVNGAPTRWPAQTGDDNLNPGKPVAYGFGWFLDPFDGQERMWHSGTTTGFRTVIHRFVHDKITVIMLSNRTDLDVTKLGLDAAAIMLKP